MVFVFASGTMMNAGTLTNVKVDIYESTTSPDFGECDRIADAIADAFGWGYDQGNIIFEICMGY